MKRSHKSDLSPVIISASRATDVPAFYSDWLLHRIREGFVDWKNPFNQKVTRVSFDQTRMFVFWSKNPKPLMERLDELHGLGHRNYYFQFTLNDYDADGLEPNVPKVAERIDTFRRLADKIGSGKVIWRFDPLLLTERITVEALLERIAAIGRQLKGYTDKLVFSFADIEDYVKVKRNLQDVGAREFNEVEKVRFARGLAQINEGLGFHLATCAEGIELGQFGIAHNKCVDDELIMRLFNDDSKLMEHIGAEYDFFNGWQIGKSKKDKGQRKACGCIASKDIGMYNTCPHLCKYCYANSSASIAVRNWQRHKASPLSETIVGVGE